MYERDATLAQVSDLPRGWIAFRPCRRALGALGTSARSRSRGREGIIRYRRLRSTHHQCGRRRRSAAFSYSLGIEQSPKLPELIVIGLRAELGQAAINACYEQMRSGTRIEPGMRVADLLGGGFECVDRPDRADRADRADRVCRK